MFWICASFTYLLKLPAAKWMLVTEKYIPDKHRQALSSYTLTGWTTKSFTDLDWSIHGSWYLTIRYIRALWGSETLKSQLLWSILWFARAFLKNENIMLLVLVYNRTFKIYKNQNKITKTSLVSRPIVWHKKVYNFTKVLPEKALNGKGVY